MFPILSCLLAISCLAMTSCTVIPDIPFMHYKEADKVGLGRRANTDNAAMNREPAFIVSVACGTNVPKAHCTKAEQVANQSLAYLSETLLLKRPIRIFMQYASFCGERRRPGTANTVAGGEWYRDDDDCVLGPRSGLGSASPGAQMSFDKEFAVEMGLDWEYAYPVGIARQYVSDDATLPFYDIRMRVQFTVS